jgi:recombination associated protein RdgC
LRTKRSISPDRSKDPAASDSTIVKGFPTMGILSSTTSITRYQAPGKLAGSLLETVRKGLQKHAIREMTAEDTDEKAVGWTSFSNPYQPDFKNETFVTGPFLIFSLRIDKKTIPAKLVAKELAIEAAKMLKEEKRDFISRNEKRKIKEEVIQKLRARIPASPSVYEMVWNYEAGQLWFFTNLKSANEELETLFQKTFQVSIVRLFPYTAAEMECDLTDAERDTLARLAPTSFVE